MVMSWSRRYDAPEIITPAMKAKYLTSKFCCDKNAPLSIKHLVIAVWLQVQITSALVNLAVKRKREVMLKQRISTSLI